MSDVNRLNISGTLRDLEVHNGTFPACSASLDTGRCVVPIWAPNEAAAELSFFEEGTEVVVKGYLGNSSKGVLRVVVQAVAAKSPPPRQQSASVACTHRMNLK